MLFTIFGCGLALKTGRQGRGKDQASHKLHVVSV